MTATPPLSTVRAERLLRAERRGSSWPVVIEAGGERWLTKLRGAAQGSGPLVAEVLVAELAAALELRVPARALVELEPGLRSDERDGELRELVERSTGTNLGFALLDGARELTAADVADVDRDLASRIVWLDGLVGNVDRTAANPNILVWRGEFWLVDHGAALTYQYDWPALSEATPRRSPAGPPHALATRATRLTDWDQRLADRLPRERLRAAAAAVPDAFLAPLGDPAWLREAHVAFLSKRLRAPRPFVPPSSG